MPLDDELADVELIVGTVAEWKRFAQRHPEFLAERGRLTQIARLIFQRDYEGDAADHIIFGLGYLCWQDFQEVLTLAGNGHGFGALKIIRGLFERLVTLRYLQEHPDEVGAFREFEHVRAYKAANELHQTLGDSVVPDDLLAKYKAERDRVLPDFMRDCTCVKDCPHKVPMHTWHKLDPVAMSAKVDTGLRTVAFAAYYMALAETHPTLMAVATRQTFKEGGGLSFANEMQAQHANADWAVCMAHTMMLNAFGTELEHFPALQPVVGQMFEDAKLAFLSIWDESKQPETALSGGFDNT
jgi:hypothetical protein